MNCIRKIESSCDKINSFIVNSENIYKKTSLFFFQSHFQIKIISFYILDFFLILFQLRTCLFGNATALISQSVSGF